MTPQQIALVRKSWSLAEPMGDTITTLFYGRLFELEPSIRNLFRHDMIEQGRNLRLMLSMVTAGLTQPEEMKPALSACGRRHLNYRIESRHYDLVRTALLWTLEQTLREHFTSETREAWQTLYDFMADTMKDAVAEKKVKHLA